MSHSFYVRPKVGSVRIPLRECLSLLREDFPELSIEEREDVPGALEARYEAVHAFLPTTTTRSLELTHSDDGDLDVRVLAGASPQDIAIAVWLAAEIARRHQTTITVGEGVGGEPLSPDALQDLFDEARCIALADQLFGELRPFAHTATLSFRGPAREFYLGPAFFARVDAAPASTYDLIRTQQWLDVVADVHAAKKVVATTVRNEELAFSAIAPDVAFLLEPVPFLCLGFDETHKSAAIFVPFEEILNLAPSAQRLDERTVLLPPIVKAEWPGFVMRARKVAETPLR